MKNESISLEYLERSLDTLNGYFISDDWRFYQTNIVILTEFVASAARKFQLGPVWEEKANFLLDISGEIHGRKRSGSNDNSLCYEVRSTIRGMKDSLSGVEVSTNYHMEEKVLNILDNGDKYISENTGR